MNARDIAEDLADYLRDHPEVCAEGNVNGWRWIRYHDGDWQATRYYDGTNRLREYVVGDVLDEETVLRWLESKPVTLVPLAEAHLWAPREQTVWDDATEQDVFTDRDRCWWCGASERTHDLTEYETTSDGECLLCPSCHESWDKAGELKTEVETA